MEVFVFMISGLSLLVCSDLHVCLFVSSTRINFPTACFVVCFSLLVSCVYL